MSKLCIIKHSNCQDGLFNSPAMYLRNLRVQALNKAEIMTIFSDMDLFGVVSLKQLFEFFPALIV